jgi:hypothetical protein
LQAVVKEVNERLPLFQAKPEWWSKNHRFGDPAHRFNAALESSVASCLLRVSAGNEFVAAGHYVLAVNNTDWRQEYSFALPQSGATGKRKTGVSSQEERHNGGGHVAVVPVLGEGRSIQAEQNRLADVFAPYEVHIYGPLP